MKQRKIRIKCNFAREVYNMFYQWSVQLSDGYWENSRGEWGNYGDGFYEELWNCFDFSCKDIEADCYSRADFIITLKAKPTWSVAEDDCERFHKMTDEEICEYLKKALHDGIEEAPLKIFGVNEYEWGVIEDCINNWEILPPPKPKLSHKELEKLVGYEFEYVK